MTATIWYIYMFDCLPMTTRVHHTVTALCRDIELVALKHIGNRNQETRTGTRTISSPMSNIDDTHRHTKCSSGQQEQDQNTQLYMLDVHSSK